MFIAGKRELEEEEKEEPIDLTELPQETQEHIFSFLNGEDLKALSATDTAKNMYARRRLAREMIWRVPQEYGDFVHFFDFPFVPYINKIVVTHVEQLGWLSELGTLHDVSIRFEATWRDEDTAWTVTIPQGTAHFQFNVRMYDETRPVISAILFPLRGLRSIVLPPKFNPVFAPLIFPDGLEKAVFPEYFNRPLNQLPASLRVLHLSRDFGQPIVLPEELVELSFYPEGLVVEPWTFDLSQARSLKRLFVNMATNVDILMPVNWEWPPALEELWLLCSIDPLDDPLPPFPASLKRVNFSINFDFPIAFHPDSILETLVFHHDSLFNSPILAWPPRLKIFQMGSAFNQLITRPLEMLEILSLGRMYNQPLDLRAFTRLRILIMGFHYNSQILLPDGLEQLHLGEHFGQSLQLPASIQRVEYPAMYPPGLDLTYVHKASVTIDTTYKDWRILIFHHQA